MKRNKTINKQRRTGKSPYAKYGKAPYRYSQSYYAWKYEMVSRVNKSKANTAKEHMMSA